MTNLAPAPLPARSPIAGSEDISVQFWGVRGSVPTPIAANERYGGNTLCVEVKMGEQHIIFDGGTGIVNLGQHLKRQGAPVDAHILFTHTQWDRIQGFPFFAPAFNPKNNFTIYGGTAPNGASTKHCLTDQMLKPHFTMPLQNMMAGLTFESLLSGDRFQLGEVTVEVLKINAETEALGYRLTWQDYTLVYATDTPTARVDLDFLKLVHQADLLIYDGTYADLNYLYHQEAKRSVTVNPWESGIDIASKASVKQMVLLHHSPVQSDEALDQLQTEIRDRFSNASIAYEGMIM